jgi:hypothetical protein
VFSDVMMRDVQVAGGCSRLARASQPINDSSLHATRTRIQVTPGPLRFSRFRGRTAEINVMKSPRIAAALVAFSLLFALAGIITSMKKASFLNLSVTANVAPGIVFSSNQIISVGNTQIELISATVNGKEQPSPSSSVISIKSACPAINGTESCFGQNDQTDVSQACLPSSAWALVVVSQFFASIAIIVQAAIAVALFMGKGSRMIHQILSVIAAVFLIISVSSVMNVPARFYSVCYSPMVQRLPVSGFSVSASYTFDAGGDLPRAPARCFSFYNCPCNRRDQSCSRAHPHLITAANFEYCGKHGAARWLCGAACR